MELDQLVFKRVLNYFKRRRKVSPEVLDRTVSLDDLIGRLTILARALTGAPIDLFSSEREGGWKNNAFFLPNTISIFTELESNVALFTFRIFYLSAQKKLGLNWKTNEAHDTLSSQLKANNTSDKVLQYLFEEYPALRDVHAKLLEDLPTKDYNGIVIKKDTTWLYGRWMKNTLDNARAEDLNNISKKAHQAQSNDITTEIQAKQADEIEVLQIDKKSQEDYTLSHNFEKVETIDEFNGNWRDFDGDDNLKEEADALEDFNINKVVRVDDPIHSVYKADFVENSSVAESSTLEDPSHHFLYPEWDYSKREYKTNYCKVFHKKILKTKASYYTKTIDQNRSILMGLRKIFAQLNNDNEQVRRLTSGDNIDLDSVVDLYASIKSGHSPDERVYMSKRKRKKELSILFLLDLSLSSDGYAKGNRIIDIEKQVSILFGEVLNEYNVDFQIDGFYSKTRNNTSYITLKAFEDPWNKAKMKIGAIEPSGYTRIGPAIRHATTQLNKRKMRKKWLILLSDGKPNDYDRYEGKYGIQDIKQALREMGTYGISNFALAIEEQAKYYLPQMFGQNHYDIISNPSEMVTSLAKLYKRIEKG